MGRAIRKSPLQNYGGRAVLPLAGQLFRPAEAIALDGGGCALEDLVAVQAEQHPHGLPLEHECAQERERQHNAPDADQVVDKHKLGVSAAAHDANVDRHLVCRAHARDAKHQQKLLCRGVGLGGEIVKLQNKRADDKECDARDDADAQEDDLHGLNVFAQLLHVPRSHRFANDDCRCGCCAHCHDLEHLEQGACNRVCGNGTIAEVAENDVLQRDRAAEDERHHDKKAAMLEIVAEQGKVGFDNVRLAHAQAFVYQEVVAENDAEFQRAGNQRTDRGTAHAQLGRAEVAPDEHVVDRAVDDQRGSRHHGGNAHDLHGAQKRQQYRAHGKEQIGPAHDGKVLHALLHDLGSFREQAHDLIGEQAG